MRIPNTPEVIWHIELLSRQIIVSPHAARKLTFHDGSLIFVQLQHPDIDVSVPMADGYADVRNVTLVCDKFIHEPSATKSNKRVRQNEHPKSPETAKKPRPG